METKIKEKKENVDLQNVKVYLEKVSKHLFKRGNEIFTTFPMEIDGKVTLIGLYFSENDLRKRAYVYGIEGYVNSYGKNAKNVISDMLFPSGCDKKESIPYFKQMREEVAEIQKHVAKNGFSESKVKESMISISAKKED